MENKIKGTQKMRIIYTTKARKEMRVKIKKKQGKKFSTMKGAKKNIQDYSEISLYLSQKFIKAVLIFKLLVFHNSDHEKQSDCQVFTHELSSSCLRG
jgi:spore cortex formation protein SpoVR/YcgB (stage V sporulation)